MDEAHVDNYSSWLESMGSLINKGEESRIFAGMRSQFWLEIPGGSRIEFQCA